MVRTFLKVYGAWLLFFVSARTNERQHHLLAEITNSLLTYTHWIPNPTRDRRNNGVYILNFRTIHNGGSRACTVVVFSVLVGARRRSAVRCGAERSEATARPKVFEEQSELEALSV